MEIDQAKNLIKRSHIEPFTEFKEIAVIGKRRFYTLFTSKEDSFLKTSNSYYVYMVDSHNPKREKVSKLYVKTLCRDEKIVNTVVEMTDDKKNIFILIQSNCFGQVNNIFEFIALKLHSFSMVVEVIESFEAMFDSCAKIVKEPSVAPELNRVRVAYRKEVNGGIFHMYYYPDN